MSSAPASPLAGRHIVLGITGSIAAYKACTLIRLLVRQGAEVQVVITPAGKEFVTPLTLATLSQHPVVSEFFDRRDGSWHSHVDLGRWADVFVVAPASAATLGKMAHGIADNMLLTTYLSMKAPTFVAPAMDLDMYAHPATQDNLDLLRRRGVHVIEAADGFLASTLVGKGRMQEPEVIVEHLARFFAPAAAHCAASAPAAATAPTDAPTSGSCPAEVSAPTPADGTPRPRLLITAGPTRERIDPVRYISNYSSGKMGFALAESAARAGYDVVLIAGPVGLTTHSPHIRRIDVESARQMHEVALREFPRCSGAILCAAVADYASAPIPTSPPISAAASRAHSGSWASPSKPTTGSNTPAPNSRANTSTSSCSTVFPTPARASTPTPTASRSSPPTPRRKPSRSWPKAPWPTPSSTTSTAPSAPPRADAAGASRSSSPTLCATCPPVDPEPRVAH